MGDSPRKPSYQPWSTKWILKVTSELRPEGSGETGVLEGKRSLSKDLMMRLQLLQGDVRGGMEEVRAGHAVIHQGGEHWEGRADFAF